jgi:hypothetical protein
MRLSTVLRNGWMDLLSAAAFPLVWLMRDRFDYDTLRALLFWPVVFEMFVAVALFVAGMLDSIRWQGVRIAALALVAAATLFAAWLCGESAGMPQVWTIALWLMVARVAPPAGLRLGTRAHRDWVWKGAGMSGMLWGAGFVATMLLMLAFSSEPTIDANGERHSVSAAWIFPLVWTPYFFAEALLRAWRRPA